MPKIEGFRVQSPFRLWISTTAIDDLPISWLQECNKIVLEPVRGIKLNAIKTLNTTSPDYMRACDELLVPFRQLYFAITFYHAIMNERDHFLSLGWSKPYEFTQADHKISAYQMLSLMKECDGNEEEIPLRLLNYVVSQLHYGGKISHHQDNRIAQEILATYLHELTITKTPFNLSGESSPTGDLEKYMMPTFGSLEHYMAHVSRLPSQDHPGIFGLHESAQLSLIEKEGDTILTKIFDIEFESINELAKKMSNNADMASVSQFKRYKTKLTDVENKIPDLIDTQLLEQNFKIAYEDSISIMMHGAQSSFIRRWIASLRSQ